MIIESLETVLKTSVVISATGPEIEIKIDTLEMIAIVEKKRKKLQVQEQIKRQRKKRKNAEPRYVSGKLQIVGQWHISE